MSHQVAQIEAPAAVPRPYLEIRQDGSAPQRRAVPAAVAAQGAAAVIGRAAGCDIVLNHPSVSRKHAELARLPGGAGWRIRDLQSRNGTRVNDAPVSEQVLRPGDLVQI